MTKLSSLSLFHFLYVFSSPNSTPRRSSLSEKKWTETSASFPYQMGGPTFTSCRMAIFNFVQCLSVVQKNYAIIEQVQWPLVFAHSCGARDSTSFLLLLSRSRLQGYNPSPGDYLHPAIPNIGQEYFVQITYCNDTEFNELVVLKSIIGDIVAYCLKRCMYSTTNVHSLWYASCSPWFFITLSKKMKLKFTRMGN